ncbi:MAG TPA: ferritin-like domain-containing protein [Chloroflexota bacterium]|nr:ferritin-like domain-containing protein [Chloroflexota bacterium]
MTPEAFVAELDALTQQALDRLGAAATAGEPPAELTVAQLLQLALKNELEAAEIAARWMPDAPERDVKLALARQAGDEAKHYRLIEERLAALGVPPGSVDPLADGYSPLYHYLARLPTTVERVAAGQFTREALALVRNEAFADFCAARGDWETARLYREVIQPDERYHHQLGRQLLLRYATTPEQQAAARRAAAGTLRLAEEIQETARLRRGITRAPGC